MSTPTVPFQIGSIESPFKLHKIILDTRNLLVCVDRIEDVGIFRKRFVYYHNYGKYIQITFIIIPFLGEPQVTTYRYPTKKSSRKPSRRLRRARNSELSYVT
jgi:hypothetical protein